MTQIEGLILSQDNGDLRFGNYKLDAKFKVSDFEHLGDSYKVKTFKEITKLERNDLFVYESVPGTVVLNFKALGSEVEFDVEGYADTQIALGLDTWAWDKKIFIKGDKTAPHVFIDGVNTGNAVTNLGGKLVFSAELSDAPKHIRVVKF